jgi:phosphatidylinositol alpha-1,6-mannosyltransferase
VAAFLSTPRSIEVSEELIARAPNVQRMAVFVTNDFPPDRGGIQRMMSRLAQEFAKLEHRVCVVAPRLKGSEAYDKGQTFRVFRYPGKSRAVSFAAMIAYVLTARITSNKPLTIASMWFPAGLAACLLPRFIRGRLTVFAHGSEIAPARGGARRRLMLFVFERADVIVANSSFTRDLLVAAGVTRPVCVVNPGMDAEAIPPARSLTPTVLSVGRLIARKGFDMMLAALPAILERYPALRYEIIGSGPQRSELETLARRLNVEANVTFRGSVNDDELRDAYARAWIFALPVRAIRNDVEGFGMVYLEAALAELPVIGGRSSGAEDAIVPDETGLLVDGTSSEQIASAVLCLLADPEKARRLGIRGRDRALGHFTWKRSAEQLARCIAESPKVPVTAE